MYKFAAIIILICIHPSIHPSRMNIIWISKSGKKHANHNNNQTTNKQSKHENNQMYYQTNKTYNQNNLNNQKYGINIDI